jgi:hypothetical protein
MSACCHSDCLGFGVRTDSHRLCDTLTDTRWGYGGWSQVGHPALTAWDPTVSVFAGSRHAKRLASKGTLGLLSLDEVGAVHVYTQESPFYHALNTALRQRDRQNLGPFLPYLKLLLRGLGKLPRGDSVVHRGVKGDISAAYPTGSEFVWWGFSSATASVQVLENPQFCGKAGPRTLFTIRVSQAVDVARLSAIGAEDERLILPGTMFEVKSSMDAGGGLRIVQVEQVQGAPSLIAGAMPTVTAVPASGLPSAKDKVEQAKGAPSLITGVMTSAVPASGLPSAKGKGTMAARLTGMDRRNADWYATFPPHQPLFLSPVGHLSFQWGVSTPSPGHDADTVFCDPPP